MERQAQLMSASRGHGILASAEAAPSAPGRSLAGPQRCLEASRVSSYSVCGAWKVKNMRDLWGLVQCSMGTREQELQTLGPEGPFVFRALY